MRCSRTHPGVRRRVVGACTFGLALVGTLVSPLLAAPVGAQEATTTPLRWEDGASSATMAISVDGDTLDAGDEVEATITWTYVGPTATADDLDPAEACQAALGSTYEESIDDWQPTLLVGSSTDVTDYALDPAGVTGPVEAVLTATEGSGTQRLRVEQCLDDGTAIARTTRIYDVTYVVPDDLPDGLYALYAGDVGYLRWWTEGEPTMLAVGAGSAPPVATTSTTAPTTATSTEGDATGDDGARPGTDDPTATTAATDSSTSGSSTTDATTADGAAGDATATTAAADATTADVADEASGFRVGVDVARTILAVGGALGALAVAYLGRKQPGRAVAERLRGLNRLATLAALAGVGLSVFVAAFDSPFMIGLLGVALCLFPPMAAKGSAAARSRARTPRTPTPGRGSGGRTTPSRTPKRAPVLDAELPRGASIEEVRALLDRSRN
jgi:hypothetical protein